MTEGGSTVEERRKRALVLAIVLLGAALRFSGLGQESLWYDEAWSVATAGAPSLSRLLEIERSDGHPALYFVLLRGWTSLFGDSESAVRSMSALAGAAVPALVYCLGRALAVPSSASLLGALLYALNTQAIWYSQEARMYSLLSCLGTLHLAFTALLLRKRRPRRRWLVPAAWWLTGLACVETHYFGFFFLAADVTGFAWVAGVLLRKRAGAGVRASRRRTEAAGLGVLLAVASVGWLAATAHLFSNVASRVRGHGIQWLDASPVTWWTPWEILGGLVVDERLVIEPVALRSATLVAFGVVLLVPLAASWRGMSRRPLWVLPLFFAAMLAGVPALVSIVRPIIMGGTRYVSIAGAPLCLAGGVGLVLVARRGRAARAIAGLVLALLTVSVVSYLATYYSGREKRIWREAVAYTAAQEPGIPIVCVPDDQVVVVAYYVGGSRPVFRWNDPWRESFPGPRVWVLAAGLPRMEMSPPWSVKDSRVVRDDYPGTTVTVFLLERSGPPPAR